jgi:hypothetical protein
VEQEEEMKTMMNLFAVAVVVCAASSQARPVRSWRYDELLKEADLAVIIRVERVENIAATLEGHGDPKQYQGKRATAIVGLVLKGEPTRKMTFDFFTYSSPTMIPPNGAVFPDLSKAEKVHYLVFLKKTPEGTFIPVGGHYDGAVSIRPIECNGLIRIEDDPIGSP